MTLDGKMHVEPIKTNFDRMDLFLSNTERDVKRICEYILNQKPLITKYSRFTGFFSFDGSVIGDIFRRSGHKNTSELIESFYCKKIDNLSSLDWQHGTSDYRHVLSVGIVGIISDINDSISVHTEPNELDFLNGLKRIAETFILWLKKCSALVSDYYNNIDESDYRENLEKLFSALLNISENAPKNFYEAVLTIYVCFSMNPDSFGTLDRYLSEFYFRDISNGDLTEEDAKAYLQELFLMVQAYAHKDSDEFTKGGQSHFCIGGRDENGNDCYNQVSQLIIESLMELDTHIPEISLRWTNDTPREVFRYVLECEKSDKNKRIAFTNDDRRIEAHTKICSFPYKEAVNYTLVGCNEPAMLGGMCASTSHANLAHSIEYVMHCRNKEIEHAKSFEAFYEVFKDQLYKDLDKIYHYDDLYNLQKAKDINYVSCLFLNGCIDNAKSITQGGVNYGVSNIMFLGNVTVIDSLAIIKQFVFEEKTLTMHELVDALKNNWAGYENLKNNRSKRGNFFGNDDETSNYTAKLFYNTLFEYIRNKKNVFGYPALIGDHTGYRLHFKWFGEDTKATPDGRYDGEPVSYGISQNNSKLRNGLTALMNSISKFDVNGISSATVTNFTLDKFYVEDERCFEKTAAMLETYFKSGGIQFQLNYTSKEELQKAKANPEKHKNLKVRVTGYSDYFTNLDTAIQDSIIQRYE